jgi:hypothetical protein
MGGIMVPRLASFEKSTLLGQMGPELERAGRLYPHAA